MYIAGKFSYPIRKRKCIRIAFWIVGNDGKMVGAHTILEMDERRSYGNEIYLKNIGEEVGVKKFTGN